MRMAKSYSVDLRLRVLGAVDKGMSKMAAHQLFQVSRSTSDDWLKLRLERCHAGSPTGDAGQRRVSRHGRLRQLLAQVGCALLPLPPYSPDLNKIEPLWHTIKTRIAHTKDQYPTFRAAVDSAFL